MVSGQKLLSGHDISDGGLITCLLEMAFGGYCGFNVDLNKIKYSSSKNIIDILFVLTNKEKHFNLNVFIEIFNKITIYY